MRRAIGLGPVVGEAENGRRLWGAGAGMLTLGGVLWRARARRMHSWVVQFREELDELETQLGQLSAHLESEMAPAESVFQVEGGDEDLDGEPDVRWARRRQRQPERLVRVRDAKAGRRDAGADRSEAPKGDEVLDARALADEELADEELGADEELADEALGDDEELADEELGDDEELGADDREEAITADVDRDG